MSETASTPLAPVLRAALAHAPSEEADERLERLHQWSPSFSRMLQQDPELWNWLESDLPLELPYTLAELERLWVRLENTTQSSLDKAHLHALQCLRRQVCLRIAYRELNALCPVDSTLKELSVLAEFCVRLRYAHIHSQMQNRVGTPWDEERNQPARFCIIALGKLGAGELNFCSDLDLIFLYEGEGVCLKNGKPATLDNREFFTRLTHTLCTDFQERSEYGTLYHIDLRLRPEGDGSPLVRSVDSASNHYWRRGQSWERLALTRARIICGDATTGGEFLEAIHPFRYPRSAPPRLAEEIAGLKIRLEQEIPNSAALWRHLKNGYGSIREIEFICQHAQIVHGGKNPFLQTPNTLEALQQLSLYGFIDSKQAENLREIYLTLRLIENRLQMREDQPEHTLPVEPEQITTLDKSFSGTLHQRRWNTLNAQRKWLHELFCKQLPHTNYEERVQAWTGFLEGLPPAESIQRTLSRCFPHAENTEKRLRRFALGEHSLSLSREQVLHFMYITEELNDIAHNLARPMQTLERVSTFAERYGARSAFFQACTENPTLFQTLAVLFDRSLFIHELLRQDPGIMEELLHEAPRRDKDNLTLLHEIHQLPQDERFEDYLWLYVRAEQVRIAIAQLLHALGVHGSEVALTRLADATVHSLLTRIDPEGKLCLIALGKYGSGELSFGSDLDMLILGDTSATPLAQKFIKALKSSSPRGAIYPLDLRLRPFGNDGPIVTSMRMLNHYHQDGHAQPWERQMLTRARFVGGNANIASEFRQWRNGLIYTSPLSRADLCAIWVMRERIEREKAPPVESAFAFKTGKGGLIDLEFLAQSLQLLHGSTLPALRDPRTRNILLNASREPYENNTHLPRLIEHHDYLRTLEFNLRRYQNTSVSHIEADSDSRRALAIWMGYEGIDGFSQAHREKMHTHHNLLKDFLAENLNLVIPIDK